MDLFIYFKIKINQLIGAFKWEASDTIGEPNWDHKYRGINNSKILYN